MRHVAERCSQLTTFQCASRNKLARATIYLISIAILHSCSKNLRVRVLPVACVAVWRIKEGWMVPTLLLLLRDESWSSTHTHRGANNKSHTSSLYGIANMGSAASSTANIIIMYIKRPKRGTGVVAIPARLKKKKKQEKKRNALAATQHVKRLWCEQTGFVITLNYVWRKKKKNAFSECTYV